MASCEFIRTRATSSSEEPYPGIQPSVMSINFSADLPLVLRIHVSNLHFRIRNDNTDGLYPELLDYGILSQFLQQLRVSDRGNLKKITMTVTMEVESTDDDELRADEVRELAKLKKVFAGILLKRSADSLTKYHLLKTSLQRQGAERIDAIPGASGAGAIALIPLKVKIANIFAETGSFAVKEGERGDGILDSDYGDRAEDVLAADGVPSARR
ncbi:hypothetical protein CCMSSC00406_0007417 [Pleurotus cornucopiae]|uniref:Uncharacterized protein n=1 Tax=Pleurotus cornucopiae TaxID=5321 RepID=A0ACB7J3L6_PLECO|nr:hypothetical protein CCMSSC00406_0007417 [Pleurotus cornucopiae]